MNDSKGVLRKCAERMLKSGAVLDTEKEIIDFIANEKELIYCENKTIHSKGMVEKAIIENKDKWGWVKLIFKEYKYEYALRVSVALYEILELSKDLGYETGFAPCYLIYRIAEKHNVIDYFENVIKTDILFYILGDMKKTLPLSNLT